MENVPEAPLPEVTGYRVRALLLDNRWLPTGEGEGGVGGEQRRLRRFSFGSLDGRALTVEVAVFEAPLRLQAVTASAAARVPVRLGGSGKPKATYVPLTAGTAVSGHGPTPAQRDRLRAAARGADGAGHSNFPGMPTYSLADICRLQGLPEDFAADLPFTMHGKRRVIGNGVPLPMGRAVARAVRRATAPEEVA
jgi:DNA (cytosine-5)-methyltransferase 1